MTYINKKEIPWINTLKAICIILVLFRHCEAYLRLNYSSFNSFVEPIYVNAFFFISGFLLYKKQLTKLDSHPNFRSYLCYDGRLMIGNMVFRIAIPSILFSSISFLPKTIIRGEDVCISEFLIETIGGCTYWFTSALLVAQVLILLLLFTRINNIWFYLLGASVFTIIGSSLSDNNVQIIQGYSAFPWLYKNGMIATIYLSLGGLYWKYESSVSKFLKPGVIAMLITIYLLLTSEFFRDYIECTTSLCTINLPGIICSVIGTLLLIELCKRIPNVNLFSYVGRNSIAFYFMSGALPAVMSIIVMKCGLVHNFITLLMSFIFCFFCSYMITKFINEYFPFIFDIRIIFNKKK